jgi:hypothetical protein
MQKREKRLGWYSRTKQKLYDILLLTVFEVQIFHSEVWFLRHVVSVILKLEAARASETSEQIKDIHCVKM